MSNQQTDIQASPRDAFAFDFYALRCVATLPITNGATVRIVVSENGATFYVDDPSLPVVTKHSTIRQAFSHAARGAGWG